MTRVLTVRTYYSINFAKYIFAEHNFVFCLSLFSLTLKTKSYLLHQLCYNFAFDRNNEITELYIIRSTKVKPQYNTNFSNTSISM